MSGGAAQLSLQRGVYLYRFTLYRGGALSTGSTGCTTLGCTQAMTVRQESSAESRREKHLVPPAEGLVGSVRLSCFVRGLKRMWYEGTEDTEVMSRSRR